MKKRKLNVLHNSDVSREKFDHSHATIHLVNVEMLYKSGIESIYCFTVRSLKKCFPHVIGKLRNGDIIENISESGYRSNGVIMYYKTDNYEELVLQNKLFDDYGSPSACFELFDFPGGYWDKRHSTNMNIHFLNLNYDIDAKPFFDTSRFYWHADYGFAIILEKSFNNSQEIFRDGKVYFHLIKRKDRNYLVRHNVREQCKLHGSTYAHCHGWSNSHQAYMIYNFDFFD